MDAKAGFEHKKYVPKQWPFEYKIVPIEKETDLKTYSYSKPSVLGLTQQVQWEFCTKPYFFNIQ